MTRKEFDTESGNAWPKTKGFRNFTWSSEAIQGWEEVWNALWRIGTKWEWQNSDRYARRSGTEYRVFSVHNDADKLDMTIPLPGREVIIAMHEYLLDLPTDDFKVDDATNLIRKWIREYVE